MNKKALYLVNSYPELNFDMDSLYDSNYNIPYGVDCFECKLLNFSNLPEKMLLLKKYENMEIDINISASGNIFCTSKVKEIINLISSDSIQFYPLYLEKDGVKSKFNIGIIRNSYITALEDDDVSRCNSCGTVIDWHPGSMSKLWSNTVFSMGEVIAVSKNIIRWKESESSMLCHRQVFFSIRLVEIFNALSIKKIYQSQLYVPIKDKLSIREALNRNQIDKNIECELQKIAKFA
jgi:hypothetical protein